MSSSRGLATRTDEWRTKSIVRFGRPVGHPVVVPVCAAWFPRRAPRWRRDTAGVGRRHELPSGVVTLMLTDVVGSTGLWQRSAAATDRALVRHTALIEAAVSAHGGELLRARGEGDSTFSVFGRASDAVRAALDAQRALIAEPWPPEARLSVRFALHSGEAIERDDDDFGPAVNRAARLRSVATGGAILLGGTTADLAVDDLPADARLIDLGPRQLGDLDRAERVFGLVADGIRSPVVDHDSTGPTLVRELRGDRPRSRGSGCCRRAAHERRDRLAALRLGTDRRDPHRLTAAQAWCSQPA